MKFKMFAATVHGKKYFERNLPCQDSSDVLKFDGVQIVAVADGHGGKDYFRSDTGAKLAVSIAFEQIKIFCSELSAEERFSESGIKNFELRLWDKWREAVKKDWDERLANMTAEPRWQNVSEKYKARFTSDEKYIPVAYGTTLICAVSIGSQVLIFQIGDGSCVVLQRNGEFKIPVPPDAENFANVTSSLCDEDAYKKFRHVVLDCAEDSPLAPVAIFLSTDGLDDCWPIFENEKHLYKFYGEVILDNIITDGFASTEKEVREELLHYMTEHGSNDDISLAYLVTKDLNLLGRTLGKEISDPIKMKEPLSVMKSNLEKLKLNHEKIKKVVEDTQPQVKQQAEQAREKLLPAWWEERRIKHD